MIDVRIKLIERISARNASIGIVGLGYGFVSYFPGPGLGGHCIPIDPFYLTWKAREFGINTGFIELAGEVNRDVPPYALVVGVPARRVGWMCSSGVQLHGKGVVTSEAGLTYRLTDTSCTPI